MAVAIAEIDLIAATVGSAEIVVTVATAAARAAIAIGISRPAMCRPQSLCPSWMPPPRRETITDEHDPKRGETPLLPPA